MLGDLRAERAGTVRRRGRAASHHHRPPQASYLALARDAALGSDGMTWQAYTRRPSHRAPLAYRLQAGRRLLGYALAIKNLLTIPTYVFI